MEAWLRSGLAVLLATTGLVVGGRICAAGEQVRPSYQVVRDAWNALNAREYKAAIRLAEECARAWLPVAQEQQQEIKGLPPPEFANDGWALNDVATAYYIAAQALEKSGQPATARLVYKDIQKMFPSAVCMGADGTYWSVAEAAKDRLLCMDLGIDFGDFKSSTLTAKAWNALQQRRLPAAAAYADKCVAIYGRIAAQMQTSLREFPQPGQEWDYWALNDVGTCLFIKGLALQQQGKKEDAAKAFRTILESYSYAQCWDDQNRWFWKVSEAARKNLQKVREF